VRYRARFEVASAAAAHEEADGCPDGDLVPVVMIVWLVSVARVVGAVARQETFGAEATLALLAVGLLPISIARTVTWWARHRGRSASSSESAVPVLAEVETLTMRTTRRSIAGARRRPATSASGTNVVSLVPRLASARKRR
jgi:hypothetical protein